MPERIQLRRTKGWRKPEGAIVVTRGTDWGNPYRVGEHVTIVGYRTGSLPALTITRDLAVALFRAYVTERGWIGQIRQELAGRDLACWCPLVDADGQPVPCHADVLLELANVEVNADG